MEKLALLLLVPALLLALTGVAVVEVKEGGPDGVHLVLPVPLLAAQIALAAAPAEARKIECPELARYGPIAQRLVGELGALPDCTLVEVRERGQRVMIRKQRADLLVDVDGDDGEEVRCRLPVRALEGVLASYDGHCFSTAKALRVLRWSARGDLVHVRSGGDLVRVRIL